MRKLLVFLILVAQSQIALATSCRDAVVIAYESFGGHLPKDSFSNSEFKDYNLSIEEFNALSSEEQEKIYMQIKPIELMVEETIGIINQRIGSVAGTFYELFMADKLQLWREARESLKSCQD